MRASRCKKFKNESDILIVAALIKASITRSGGNWGSSDVVTARGRIMSSFHCSLRARVAISLFLFTTSSMQRFRADDCCIG